MVYGFTLIYHLNDSSIFQWMHHPQKVLFQTALIILQNRICVINKSSLWLQKAELRCLLPRSLLDRGFFSECTAKIEGNDKCEDQVRSHSWSGQRKMPSYLNKLVFPDNFLTALRTIALQEDEIFQVSSMLEEVRVL